MGKHSRGPPTLNRADFNVAFGVILDKPSAKLHDLLKALKTALHAHGRTTLCTKNVKELLDRVAQQRHLVRPYIKKDLRAVHARQIGRPGGLPVYRIDKGLVDFMDGPIKQRWDKQMKDAEDTAARWNEAHKNYEHGGTSINRRGERAGVNAHKYHDRERTKKAAGSIANLGGIVVGGGVGECAGAVAAAAARAYAAASKPSTSLSALAGGGGGASAGGQPGGVMEYLPEHVGV